MAKYKTSPAGKAVYPRLTHPDTKFDAGGVYKTGLTLSGEPAQRFKKYIDKLIGEAQEKAREDGIKASVIKNKINRPYEELEDDEGDLTGEILFTFKLKASGKTRDGEEFTQRPNLFDAKGTPIAPKDIQVYGGSTIKVAFDHVVYANNAIGVGVSLRLRAAQIIELVQGGASADTFGFGEEDGFEASESTFSDTSADADEADDAEDDEDF